MVKLPLKDEEEEDDKNENRTQQIEKKIKNIKWEFQKRKKKTIYIRQMLFLHELYVYIYIKKIHKIKKKKQMPTMFVICVLF